MTEATARVYRVKAWNVPLIRRKADSLGIDANFVEYEIHYKREVDIAKFFGYDSDSTDTKPIGLESVDVHISYNVDPHHMDELEDYISEIRSLKHPRFPGCIPDEELLEKLKKEFPSELDYEKLEKQCRRIWGNMKEMADPPIESASPPPVATVENVVADYARYPTMAQAATGGRTPDIIIDGNTTEIGDTTSNPLYVRDVATTEAINKLTEHLVSVFPPPDESDTIDIPNFNQDGFWVSQNDYARRIHIASKTLSGYRESRYNPVRLSDGVLKIKGGHFCRQTGNRDNSPYEFFVLYEQ